MKFFVGIVTFLGSFFLITFGVGTVAESLSGDKSGFTGLHYMILSSLPALIISLLLSVVAVKQYQKSSFVASNSSLKNSKNSQEALIFLLLMAILVGLFALIW